MDTRQRWARREPALGLRRALAVLAITVLSCTLSAPGAVAGPFSIGWNGNLVAHGFAPKTDSGAPCAYPGAAASAQAGTFPSYGACFFIFSAPGASTITGVHTVGRFSKASASANLCAQSFADVGSPAPLNLCTGGDFDQVIPVASGHWIEIGLRNKYDAAIAIGTSNANNVNLSSGTVGLDDPSLPSANLSGQIPAWLTGDAISLNWSASDPESSIGSASYQVDGGAPVGLLADGCQDVFVCGVTRGGTFVVTGLSQLPDGEHSVALSAASAGGTAGFAVQLATDHTPPTFVGDPNVDRTARRISWVVLDQTSGISGVTETADGVSLTPTLTPNSNGTSTASVVIPTTSAFGLATLTATVTDIAGNATSRSFTIPADPAPTASAVAAAVSQGAAATSQATPGDVRTFCPLTARAALRLRKHPVSPPHLRVKAGRLVRVDGALSCASGGSQRLTVVLVNAAHPRLSRTWTTTTRPDGTYTVWLRPRVSGRLTTGFAGTAALQSTSASAHELVRIVPVIEARFTAKLTSTGFINPTVHGTLRPSPGAATTLAWQARIPGGRWQLIGSLAATVRPKSDGTFVRQLRVGPLDKRVQLRLIYLGIPGGPYTTAVSPPQFLK